MTHNADRLVQIAQGKLATHGRAPLSDVEELVLREKAAEFNRIPTRDEILSESHIQWLREFATPDEKRWDRRTYFSPPPPAPAPTSKAPLPADQAPGHLAPAAVSEWSAAGPALGGSSSSDAGGGSGKGAAARLGGMP